MNRKEVWGLTSVVSASRANSINGVYCGTNKQVSVLIEVVDISFSTLAHAGMHDASCIYQKFDICKKIFINILRAVVVARWYNYSTPGMCEALVPPVALKTEEGKRVWWRCTDKADPGWSGQTIKKS